MKSSSLLAKMDLVQAPKVSPEDGAQGQQIEVETSVLEESFERL